MRRKDHGRTYAFIVRVTPVIALITACLAIPGHGSAASGSDCLSPRTTSPVYTGDKESGINQANQTSWRVGVLAITAKPNADIIVSFRAPTDQNWHDSKPVSSKNASRILLKVGTGDVQFSTEYHASSGNSACNNPPATTFSPNTQTLSSIAPNTTQATWPSTSSTTNPSPTPQSNNSATSNGSGSSDGSSDNSTDTSGTDNTTTN